DPSTNARTAKAWLEQAVAAAPSPDKPGDRRNVPHFSYQAVKASSSCRGSGEGFFGLPPFCGASERKVAVPVQRQTQLSLAGARCRCNVEVQLAPPATLLRSNSRTTRPRSSVSAISSSPARFSDHPCSGSQRWTIAIVQPQ